MMKKIAFVDIRMRDAEIASLSHLTDDIVRLPPHPRLAPPVASHPDMLMFPCGDGMIMRREYLDIYPALDGRLRDLGIKIIYSDNEAYADYPRDIALNAVVVGDVLLSSTPYTDEKILGYAKAHGMRAAYVKQGYSSCSTLVLDDRHIVTSDAGIAKAAEKNGISALVIPAGHIGLDGYDYGFIGGTAGVDDGLLITCGDVSTHPAGDEIAELAKTLGIQIVPLCDGTLTDRGKIFIITVGDSP